MEKSMTYRRPISGCAAVECSLGKTLMVEHRPGYPTVVSGTIIDRLREYEEIGTPEYFKRLAKKEELERARSLAISSIYGGYVYKIDEKAFVRCVVDHDVTDLWPKSNPHLKKDKPALPEIDHVIFNNPATIVFWKDDTKTVVKANNGEPYDPEKGLAMAMVKKVSGNKGNYYNVIRKELDKNPYDISEVAHVDKLNNALHCLSQCDRGVHMAYGNLYSALINKKATKSDLIECIKLALGNLGELVDEGGPLD